MSAFRIFRLFFQTATKPLALSLSYATHEKILRRNTDNLPQSVFVTFLHVVRHITHLENYFHFHFFLILVLYIYAKTHKSIMIVSMFQTRTHSQI